MKEYKSNIASFSLKKEKSEFNKVKINSSKDASDYIRNFYSDDIEIYESFFILLMNRNNNTVGYAKISQGGIAGTVVDVSVIAKYVVDTFSSGVILAHNHPSGNTKPSEADISLTKKIKDALGLFSCSVLDHIILTENSYFSLADEGLL